MKYRQFVLTISSIIEPRLVSDVENDIEIKNQGQEEIISHQENHQGKLFIDTENYLTISLISKHLFS